MSGLSKYALKCLGKYFPKLTTVVWLYIFKFTLQILRFSVAEVCYLCNMNDFIIPTFLMLYNMANVSTASCYKGNDDHILWLIPAEQ